MQEIPADVLLSEDSMSAGVAAMARIHGHHLPAMSEDEQAAARLHWREQVQEVLVAVHAALLRPEATERGRAVISFSDGAGDTIDVSAAFVPQLNDLGDGQVEGTPAQVMAVSVLEQLGGEEEDD